MRGSSAVARVYNPRVIFEGSLPLWPTQTTPANSRTDEDTGAETMQRGEAGDDTFNITEIVEKEQVEVVRRASPAGGRKKRDGQKKRLGKRRVSREGLPPTEMGSSGMN